VLCVGSVLNVSRFSTCCVCEFLSTCFRNSLFSYSFWCKEAVGFIHLAQSYLCFLLQEIEEPSLEPGTVK